MLTRVGILKDATVDINSGFSAAMSRPKTLIYAELLSNIRQISIIAALEVPSDSSTKAELSKDGYQFLLHHDGNVHTLNLPGSALPDSRLQTLALGSMELSWRLPLAGEPRIPSAESSDAPWPAKDLKESSEFRCRSCGEVVVGKGAVRVWKDLPSENWAEMMDFWHCHKPSVHEPNGSTDSGDDPHDKDHGVDRGYGANTKFAAQPMTGFVDLTTLLLAKPDCHGIEVRILSLRPYPILSRQKVLHMRWVLRRRPSLAAAIQWRGHRYRYPISTFFLYFFRSN
jgi:ubiquitin-protein ligase E3 D